MIGRWWRHRERPDLPDQQADDVARLLVDVRALRLSLGSDLSAAAGAIDDERLAVARDIVSADRAELLRLTATAHQRLAAVPLASDDAPTDPAVVAASRPGVPRQRRRSRALLLVPALPLAGALSAVAVAAVGGPVSHHGAPAARGLDTSGVAVTQGADDLAIASSRTTLSRLTDVVLNHPTAAAVVSLSGKLHHQLAVLLHAAPNDPQRLAEVRQVLTMERSLLRRHTPPGVQAALADAAHLASSLLRTSTTVIAGATVPTSQPQPSHPTTHRHHRHLVVIPRRVDTAHPASASPTPVATSKPQTASPSPSTTPEASQSPEPLSPFVAH